MDSMWPSLVLFLLVLAALPLSAWWVRRAQSGRAGGNAALSVASAVAVGTRERIALVRADRTWLVVGITAQSITLLARLDEAPAGIETLEAGAGTTGFADVLRAISRHGPNRG